MMEHKPKHPERTAFRSFKAACDPIACDVEIREFPSVGAMQACIQMQQQGENWSKAFRPWPKVAP
jgi:hypothetical protein